MTEEQRRNCTPQDYIRRLYAETCDGKLTIYTYPLLDEAYSESYRMNWTKEDAEKTVEEYQILSEAITRVGSLFEDWEDEERRREGLSAEEEEIWKIYLRPFDDFGWDLNYVADLGRRRETETLTEEEYDLLERYYHWFSEQSRRRLPFGRWCPAQLINRAQRYEALVRSKASPEVLREEGRCLAEELVLYRHGEKKIVFDSLKFLIAQGRVYDRAYREIRNGQKRTHWMWYIFPQLKELSVSRKAQTYGIADLDEAEAFLNHPVLGARLREVSRALLALKTRDPEEVFGEIDAMKLRSSMTLFAALCEEGSVFHRVIDGYFNGEKDPRTIELLAL